MRDNFSFDETEKRETLGGGFNIKKILIWVVPLVVIFAAVYIFVFRGGGDKETNNLYSTAISEATLAFNRGDYREAKGLYTRALVHKPDDALAAHRIAMIDSILVAAAAIPEDTLQPEPEEQVDDQRERPAEKAAAATRHMTYDTAAEEEETDLFPARFHVIVGCFEVESNAAALSNKLKARGINSTIIPIGDGTMTAVSYNSFATKEEAVVELRRVQREFDKDAWILEYEKPARPGRLRLDPK